MKNPNIKLYLLYFYCDIYFDSLFTSLKAFLPSFRVLNTSQEREEIIKKVSEIREIKIVSVLFAIKLTNFQD